MTCTAAPIDFNGRFQLGPTSTTGRLLPTEGVGNPAAVGQIQTVGGFTKISGKRTYTSGPMRDPEKSCHQRAFLIR